MRQSTPVTPAPMVTAASATNDDRRLADRSCSPAVGNVDEPSVPRIDRELDQDLEDRDALHAHGERPSGVAGGSSPEAADKVQELDQPHVRRPS